MQSVGGADFTITMSAPENEVQVGGDARVTITLRECVGSSDFVCASAGDE